ncbi:hypothetical protein ACGGZK_03125 [Agromyces sp. MMS24-K17]|uniref:hypothetical protein n=1 Tax=Agromyces sp. MMS24-K17 TaxID=3372850 RepID=UPI00375511E4
MDVVIAPWSPWPLVFPAIVLAAGVVLTFVGTLRERRWARDLGIILVVLGGLSAVTVLGFASGTWDQEQRRAALVQIGYEEPTFSGGTGIVGSMTPGEIDFRAVRDGEAVTGTLVPLGGDRWQVVEDDAPADGE